MQTFIENMPKAELHVHLEGTLEPELSFELAQRNGIDIPYRTPEEMIQAYDFHDLPSFLKIYYAAMAVLQKEQDFYQLTWQYLKKAQSQKTLYVELFFDPQAHTSRGVSFDTVITGIRRAQEQARVELGVESQLIMCFLRDMDADSAWEHLQLVKPYRDWIVGVGLDSDEKDNPPIKFERVFREARGMGLKLTMHCDVNQKNTLAHIGQCLDEIGVDRIDHGVNSLEDERLWRSIRDKGLGLTVCPVSNRFVVQSLTSGEIRQMLANGMKATINSDDPAYFRAYLNENLLELQAEGDFTRDEIATLVANAFEVSWLPEERKRHYLTQLNQYLTAVAA
ncbi:adenosine deaminase [Marinimicrobium agarilyticum]|uniref:adenosine deaminase n=1 Tax=Marinimicrobium agarilyticum TaxID=306546 RepID=UPI0003F4B753|nr:adenosine deaminase [Marinimicrobium agarilyticum]